jgi:hypothetical protein
MNESSESISFPSAILSHGYTLGLAITSKNLTSKHKYISYCYSHFLKESHKNYYFRVFKTFNLLTSAFTSFFLNPASEKT